MSDKRILELEKRVEELEAMFRNKYEKPFFVAMFFMIVLDVGTIALLLFSV